MGFFNTLDVSLLNQIQSFRTPVFDKLAPIITALGDEGIFWISFSLLLMCFVKTRRTGVLMLMALTSTYLISTLGLKHLFARPRPCMAFGSIDIYHCPSGFSFPSGHSISSFAAAGVLYFKAFKGKEVFLLLAGLIALSRVYLFAHYPSDVFVGSLLGFLTAWILVRIDTKKRPVQ